MLMPSGRGGRGGGGHHHHPRGQTHNPSWPTVTTATTGPGPSATAIGRSASPSITDGAAARHSPAPDEVHRPGTFGAFGSGGGGRTSAMAHTLGTILAVKSHKRESIVEAAAGPMAPIIPVAGAAQAAPDSSPLGMALGGALLDAVSELQPDWDVLDEKGPLGDVVRADLGQNPALLIAATGGWRDPDVITWAAQRAPRSVAVAGLADSPLATALMGPETGLAIIDIHGRLTIMADRAAPITRFTLPQVAELLDRAMRDAGSLVAAARKSRRPVTSILGSTQHASLFGALAQTGPECTASAGTRFAWGIGQLVTGATEYRVTPGMLAQVLLLLAVAGGPLVLAARSTAPLFDAHTARLLVARAAIPPSTMPILGAGTMDEAAVAAAMRRAWASAPTDTWRSASPHDAPALIPRRSSGDGGGPRVAFMVPTSHREPRAPRTARADSPVIDPADDSRPPNRREPRAARRPRSDSDATDSEAEDTRPKRKREAASSRATPARSASDSDAPPQGGRPAPRASAAARFPRPPPGQTRDTHDRLRCFEFAATGACSNPSPCEYSHLPPAPSKATAPERPPGASASA